MIFQKRDIDMASKAIPIMLLILGLCGTVFGAEASGEAASAVEAAKDEIQLNINIVWTCVAAFLVFFMSAGAQIRSVRGASN